VVHGRRFVAVGLVECIDMADNKRQERAAEMRKEGAGASLAQQLQTDEDLEMSAETIEELKRQLRYEEQDKKTEEAERRFRERQKTGDEDTQKFSGGGIVRGTRAQTSGRRFSGVY
jgi:hypothetical protein